MSLGLSGGSIGCLALERPFSGTRDRVLEREATWPNGSNIPTAGRDEAEESHRRPRYLNDQTQLITHRNFIFQACVPTEGTIPHGPNPP